MLEKLKIMLCFEDSTQDEKLMLILDSVESRLRLLLGGADPPDARPVFFHAFVSIHDT